MKLKAKMDDLTHEIDIKQTGERVQAAIDDRLYDIEASEPEPGIFLFKHEGRIFEALVTPQTATGGPFAVKVGRHSFEIDLTDPKRLRASSADAEHTGGTAEIKTAMPGKVVRILVAAGDTVQKGDGVVVVEAMKMQNELKSPKDGTIADIRVAEGDTVSSGDILIVID